MNEDMVECLRKAADHLDKQVFEIERKMTEANVVSPFAQNCRSRMAAGAEALRQEIVRLETGKEFVIGPMSLKLEPLSLPFGMSQPDEDS